MISAKGTQQNPPEATTPGSRYAFVDAQILSRIPIYIGLFIASVAAYLKVSLSPPAQPLPPEEPSEPEPGPATAFTVESLTAPVADPPEPETEAEPAVRVVAEAEVPLRQHQGNVIDFPLPKYALVDSPALHFSAPQPAGRTQEVPAQLPETGGSGPGPGGGGAGGTEPPEAQSPAGKRNRPPEVSGPVRLNGVMAGTAVLIGLNELLANVVDPDGDALAVRNLRVSSGSIGTVDGGWVYSSNAQAAPGPVQITYEITDGEATVTQTATLDLGRGAPITGSQANDIILGNAWADSINGLGGADLIDARGGDDTIFGGDGDDLITAGSGNDVVFAGLGEDVVFGGEGNDVIAGGGGNDQLFGDAGNDTVLGEEGNDLLHGGDGDDFVSGGDGDDALHGDAGNDDLNGGGGGDLLVGGSGSDRVFGDAGDDTVIAAMDGEGDLYDGGEGTDVLDISATQQGVDINLVTGKITGIETGTDAIAAFETILAGNGDDTIIAGSSGVSIYGKGGDDTVTVATNAASDHFDGGDGHDRLDYSAATLDITLDLRSGEVKGVEVGHDTMTGFETIVGGAGNDVFHVGSDPVALVGGDGSDTFTFTVSMEDVLDRPLLLHEILDFLAGDRILVSEYEFTTSRDEDREDRFSRHYRDRDEENEDLQLRIRHDTSNGEQFTLLEFNCDDQSDYELVVALHGHHQPYLYENAIA